MHKLNRAKLLLGAPLLALLLTGAQAAQAGVLEKVKAHGSVRCGVAGDKPGFSLIDDKGRWTGMDVDLCRAVAAAVLGDADKVEYLTTTAKNRFTARLKQGLSKTSASIGEGMASLFLGKKAIDARYAAERHAHADRNESCGHGSFGHGAWRHEVR